MHYMRNFRHGDPLYESKITSCKIEGCSEPLMRQHGKKSDKFYSYCTEHYREYMRQKSKEYYERHKKEENERSEKWAKENSDRAHQINAKSYQRNKTKRKLEKKQYREKNLEAAKARDKRYYARPEIKLAKITYSRIYGPKWTAKNPLAVKAAVHRRKTLKANASGFFTEKQLQERINYYGNRCYLCRVDLATLPEKDRTIDHVIPFNKGGTNWPANLRPACRSCNSAKSDKSLDEYLKTKEDYLSF